MVDVTQYQDSDDTFVISYTENEMKWFKKQGIDPMDWTKDLLEFGEPK